MTKSKKDILTGRLKSVGLIGKFKGSTYSNIAKAYARVPSGEFVHSDVDIRELINSSNTTTLDALLSKFDTKGLNDLSYSLNKLISLNKENPTGYLFDAKGNKITDTVKVAEGLKNINTAKVLVDQRLKSLEKESVGADDTVPPAESEGE